MKERQQRLEEQAVRYTSVCLYWKTPLPNCSIPFKDNFVIYNSVLAVIVWLA